jgi:hypothetical protein
MSDLLVIVRKTAEDHLKNFYSFAHLMCGCVQVIVLLVIYI